MFSNHFKNSLKAIGIAAMLLVGVYIYLKRTIRGVIVRAPIHVKLPSDDKELITYNENRHVITVTTPKGTTSAYSRNPSVEIRNDGTVKVDDHAYGTELRPILGVGVQDTGRVYLGVNLFYVRQFDLFIALGFPLAASSHPLVEPFGGVSWNFWSNTSLAIGFNPVNVILHERPDMGIALTVRL